MTKIYIVRHGETVSNRELRFQGRTDTPLNECGRKQALGAAEYFKNIPLAAIYSSPLQRARVTAQTIAAAQPRQLDVQLEQDLQEICFGEWEGHNFEEVEKLQPGAWNNFFARPSEVKINGAESLAAAQRRARAAFNCAAQRHPNDAIALVTHGAVIRVLFCSLLGVDLNHIWQIHTANAGISRFTVDTGYVSLDFFNLRVI